MQWLAFIKDLQARDIPVIVDLSMEDIDEFIEAMDPKGLFLWVATDDQQGEVDILTRIEKWT